MNEKVYCFEVVKADLDAFLGSLMLGTLQAMRSGLWSLDAGIWTLGRPCFRDPLERASVPEELVAVLQEADELSALAELAGRAAADARLDELIAIVQLHLAKDESHHWRAVVRE
ncbi:hypothetical protein [Polyangium sorediatum]|uniref:Uncharacterized protein n=1 Tax=Polyangium sorediatum TaxID=889274 RepID=A0ABT6P1Y7_9BACT|nr:hypothetical protein [Polyangium sorediatum]MDI1434620.1 hypothetical protein [Polyangium sorediatum]